MSSERIEESIHRFLSAAKEAGVVCRVEREEKDDPFDFLISRSRYADLTVLSLRSIFEYDIRGPEDDDASITLVRLLSGGVRPILAVPKKIAPVKKVFAAYSGSIESAATLRRFLQIMPYNNIELRIATFEMDEQRSNRLLKQATRYCSGYNLQPETIHVPSKASDSLLDQAAEYQADLVVMGNSARNILLRRMLGETALRAIREAEVPLFLSQ